MDHIGRYAIHDLLGRGGSGAVYRADLVGAGGHRTPVALKLLHDGGETLWQEARLGGLLRHRHLVDVYEIGEDDGQWFCAMELCQSNLTQHTPLPPRAVVEVGTKVCEALAYAHDELGLVHLDIKPDNLLLSDAGDVKLADLGIARAEGFATDTRHIRGTRGFMAPEQLRGGPLDARTDVFALGVTLAELAVGRRTASEGTLDLDAVVEVDTRSTLDLSSPSGPERTSEVEGPQGILQVPEWLAPVVERCVAVDPDDRYASMEALRHALSELDQGLGGETLAHSLGIVAPNANRRVVAPRDRFVGRVDELELLATHLATPGLITLWGMGGIGKTRLAHAATQRWQATEGRQAWFVDLTDIQTLGGLHYAMADALDVPLKGADPTHQLGLALAGRGHSVLVLDTFEQLIDHRDVVGRWLALAPACRILVTSRAPLELSAEQLIPVEPLDATSSRELLIARAARRGAQVADDPHLEALAEALDGLPLALELAAGRLGVLSTMDVLDRLGDGILRSANEGRHGTLEAALAWSWALLGPAQQDALVQLTVFEGGCTFAAANDVLGLPEGADVRDALRDLVRHALVRQDGPRMALLPRVAEFARAKGDTLDAERRHMAYFARCGTPERVDAGRAGIAREHRIEHANIVTAYQRALSARRPVVVPLARAAWVRQRLTGPYAHARILLDEALAIAPDAPRAQLDAAEACGLAGDDPGMAQRGEAVLEDHGLDAAIRARAAACVGRARTRLGHAREAREYLAAGLSLAREAGAGSIEAVLLNDLAMLDHLTGHLDLAEAHLERCHRIAREVGDRQQEATALHNLGLLLMERGLFPAARVRFEESLQLARQTADRRVQATANNNLGQSYFHDGHVDACRRYYDAAIALSREVGDQRLVGATLNNLGTLHFANGDLPRARLHHEEDLAIAETLGHVHALAVARANLGDVAAAAGDLDAAKQHFHLAIEHLEAVGNHKTAAAVQTALAVLQPPREGLATIEAAEVILRDAEHAGYVTMTLARKAEILHQLGEGARAAEALAEARTGPLRSPDVASVVARAARALGVD